MKRILDAFNLCFVSFGVCHVCKTHSLSVIVRCTEAHIAESDRIKIRRSTPKKKNVSMVTFVVI